MPNLQEPPCQRSRRIVVLTATSGYSFVLINALAAVYPNLVVVQEQPESRWAITIRRARRLGWTEALGQLATMAASRVFKSLSQARQKEIYRQYDVSNAPDAAVPIMHVGSINDPKVLDFIQESETGAVLTIGCRIVHREILARIGCPTINFHAGINPMYRGQMGGYWSMVEDDAENFGATLHLVDAGVDTDQTLYAQRVSASRKDTMSTYPLLLAAASIGITVRAVDDALTGNLRPYRSEGVSVLRYPPPIWAWLRHGIIEGIW
jgi:folate-dependent phosphoribosylglycinamide formyltransferase PurN